MTTMATPLLVILSHFPLSPPHSHSQLMSLPSSFKEKWGAIWRGFPHVSIQSAPSCLHVCTSSSLSPVSLHALSLLSPKANPSPCAVDPTCSHLLSNITPVIHCPLSFLHQLCSWFHWIIPNGLLVGGHVGYLQFFGGDGLRIIIIKTVLTSQTP